MDNQAKKGILTLGIGQKFNRQAKYLAYSCILHSPTLPRAIITDNCDYFNGLFDVMIPYKADMGDPFKVKLQLQHYSPFYETLFLDSDTLVYTDLHFMWDYFDGQSIVYAGSCRKDGEWYFKEIDKVLQYYNIPWIGQLNSGIFMFKKDDIGLNVLNYAVELHGNHGDINIPYFRGNMFADEPFLAVALGKYNQLPREDFGRLGRSLINSKTVKLDIIKGISKFIKDGKVTFPAIVHFCGDKKNYYIKEKLKLLFYYKGIPLGMIMGCFINIIRGFLLCLNFVMLCKRYAVRHLLRRRHSI